MTFRTTMRVTMLLAGATAALAGCESKPKAEPEPLEARESKPGNEFFVNRTPRSSQAFANAQAAAGARHDATLGSQHFDGTELNSLGRTKLNLMTTDRDEAGDRELSVYLNFAETESMEARREAVMTHLRSRGLADEDVKFVSGINPHTRTAAEPSLSRLPRTDSDHISDGGAGFGSGGPVGAAPSMK
jgi:hypothetical protein